LVIRFQIAKSNPIFTDLLSLRFFVHHEVGHAFIIAQSAGGSARRRSSVRLFAAMNGHPYTVP
jgi:hypothetical protein